MENSIKELIELSTSSGAIKQESRDLIYLKAEIKGISKTECDIYIENALNVISKQDGVIKTEKSFRGWWFILAGIVDFIWGASIVDNRYTEVYGVIGLISGTLFILVGMFLLGWLNVKLLKKIGFLKIGFFLLSVVLGYLITFIILSPFIALELNSLVDFVAWPVYLSILFIISYIFRCKILGENASKVEIPKLNTFLQPFLNKLPTSVLDFLKKV
tara:strand:- start:1113 stop:1760 length:648 start_codon:yes stop_codon:yes gene_type:complete